MSSDFQGRLSALGIRALFAGLTELFRGWSSLGGSKSLILFYELGTETNSRGSASVLDNQWIHESLEEVAQWAAASGFTIYGADTTGLSNPAAVAKATALRAKTVAHALATETGGRHVAVNDIARVIEIATWQAQNHYRLSFQVSRAADGAKHDLRIKDQPSGSSPSSVSRELPRPSPQGPLDGPS